MVVEAAAEAQGEASAEAEAQADTAELLACTMHLWSGHAGWVRDIIHTLGAVDDFENARYAFECASRPRSASVWDAMVHVCNQCGEPAFASRVFAQMIFDAQSQGPGTCES